MGRRVSNCDYIRRAARCTSPRRRPTITARRSTAPLSACAANSTNAPCRPDDGSQSPRSLDQAGRPVAAEALTGDAGLDRVIPSPEASSPGLVLAGYTARFARAADRLHILGETEITYLASLDAKARRKAIETFLGYDLPCIFVTKGQQPPEELVTLAAAKGIAVIRSRLKTDEFFRRLKPFLDDAFAPSTTVHGSLADVFGVGCCSAVGRGSARASACSIWWSAGTAWS